ncbi:MAG: cell division ATPase MinD [Nanobdellota archaeon]
MEQDKQFRTTFIGVLSAKGGVGKTTTAVNLSSALQQFGRETIVVDGNYTKPNVGLMLGITKVGATLHNSLKGSHGIEDAIYVHPSGINVIPGSILYDELNEKHSRKLKDIIESLRGKTEAVIIDSGPGVNQELLDIIDTLDKAVIVTTPEVSSITDALKTKRICKERGVEIIGILITHVRKKDYECNTDGLESFMEENIIGEIPYDENIKISQYKKYPVVYADFTTPATIAYKKFAANIIGEKYEPEYDESIFTSILRRIGLK